MWGVGAASRLILALLRGGPDGIPRVWEMPWGGIEAQIKIPRGNGYEHFEFSQEYADIGGQLMPVYLWSYRTVVAE